MSRPDELPAAHVDHDLLLVAAAAAGDGDEDAATGERLVAACPDCATVHGELLSLAAAVRALPAPRRPRDFRLTSAQARANRPRWWQAFLVPFSSTTARARPVGALLVTVGLAGLLLGLLPGSPADTFQSIQREVGQGVPGVALPPPNDAGASAGVAVSPDAAVSPVAPSPAAAGTPCASPDLVLGPLACTAPGSGDTAAAGPATTPAATPASGGGDMGSRLARDDRPLIALSVVAIAAGLVLLGLVALAKRAHVDGGPG